MEKAVDRFQRLEMGNLEAEEFDTCMMDLVLRRQVLEAKKAKRPLTNPKEDQSMLDEMFVMLVGVSPFLHVIFITSVELMKGCIPGPRLHRELPQLVCEIHGSLSRRPSGTTHSSQVGLSQR